MRLPPLATEVLAGYVAGSAKTLAFYPLDTLTTLREIGARSRKRSFGQLYAGCGLTLLGAAPYALIFHTALWLCERLLRPSLSGTPVRLVASMVGAIAAAVVGVPFECLKHRLQLGVPGYTTPVGALATTLRADGVRGLYTGLGATLARNIPYNALHFGLFDLVLTLLMALGLPPSSRDPLAGAVAGARTHWPPSTLAAPYQLLGAPFRALLPRQSHGHVLRLQPPVPYLGLPLTCAEGMVLVRASVTALLTTPMDLINTRLQTQAISGAIIGANCSTSFAGPVDALTTIFADEGPAALMTGAGTRVAQYAPSALVFFWVYEAIKRHAVA